MSNQPKRARWRPADAVAAAEFKAKCLELLDHVRESGTEYVVTKHGKPVARVVPYRAADAPMGFGALKGSVLTFDRPFDPVDADYDVNRD